MNLSTAKAAIDMRRGEAVTIQFAGGEPLLNPDYIEQVCQYAATNSNEAVFQIQTNATLITKAIARMLKRYRIGVGVSLDGSIETNDYQRGSTRAAIEGIRLLFSEGITVNLNAVVTNHNVDRLNELVDMAIYLGNVHGIGLDLFRKAGRALDEKCQVSEASSDSLRMGLQNLYKYLKTVNHVVKPAIIVREFEKARVYPQNSDDSVLHYCYAAQGQSYVVLPNGDVYPCGSLAGQKQYAMGNVHNSVKPISIQCKKPKTCLSCEYASYCPGGCPSRGLLNGGFDELDCVMRKTTFQLTTKVTDKENK
jgi:uncharacterized protein